MTRLGYETFLSVSRSEVILLVMPRSVRRKRPGQYHHGDLKRALIDEALKLIDEEGLAGVSTRALARRLGVSHAAPGHHFADREALLTEVASEGFRMFADALERAAAGETEPSEQFVALGRAYLRFAADHPSYLRVMFGRGLPEGYCPPERYRHESERAYAVLTTVTHDLTLALGGDPAPLDELAFGAWALVHGMAMLWIDGATRPAISTPAELEDTGARIVRRAILGIVPRSDSGRYCLRP